MNRPNILAISASLSLILASALGSTVVHAGTWVWLDDGGRKIYSDLPPPSSVPDKRILQQPGRAVPSASSAVEPVAPPTPPTPAGTSAPVGKTKAGPAATDPAAQKKQQEAKKAADAERQAQEEKNATIRAANCRNAQTSMRTLQSGVRMVTTDDNGNQVIMDDTLRAAEAQRLQAAMQANCD